MATHSALHHGRHNLLVQQLLTRRLQHKLAAAPCTRVPFRGSGRVVAASGSGDPQLETKLARTGGRQGIQPSLPLRDVDKDLYEVLDLATEEELEDIYKLLFGRSLLSPLVKTVVGELEPPAVEWRGREALIISIERRFRFLAAPAESVLRGRWPSYRETLLHVRERLGVQCPSNLATNDLETEIFLHLLESHAAMVDVVSDDAYSAAAAAHAMEGDGMARSGSGPPPRPGMLQRLVSQLQVGAEEVTPALAKLAGLLWFTNMRGTALKSLGTQVVNWKVRHEAAMGLLMGAASKGAAGLRDKAVVQAAQKGLTVAASRYAAVRSLLSLLGPLMWASLAIDLARLSIGTDFARCIKAVFMLAQIRLLRTHGFQNAGA